MNGVDTFVPPFRKGRLGGFDEEIHISKIPLNPPLDEV